MTAINTIANICWIMEKARELKKQNIYFCFTEHAKAFDCLGHTDRVKFFKRWEYQTTLPSSEKPVCSSRSNS